MMRHGIDHHGIDHGAVPRDARSEADILAEARDMQARHAPAVLSALGRWLRGPSMDRAGLPSIPVARRLVVH